ncbi:hypothetical protein [Pseudochrobactrum kiredjianiae]|uniref:DUF4376 domain-containing protein n=1 Tax=Pseudochrobactrum kiredjianiae TaxID=386305 RepID=A0ABW3V4F4_9HYPH|nr:hypothetical protein [Pseudochrobactrum kiredjianiae]MDM7852679.1 hypothetical protein [Pseudochrobactrum kiredjianiae]
MNRFYYSSSQSGFFTNSVHAVLPDDAVEITPSEHSALLNGQAVGLRIVADANGKPILQAIDNAIPLEVVKLTLKMQIDQSAETERLKYITPGTGQAMTYQQKVAEAQAYKSATNPNPEDYPILASEVGITAPTLAEVADTVLAAYHQWQQIGAAIEAIRLGAKRDIDESTTEAAARAVLDSVTWPQPAI